jgi:hypothetical protein
MNSRAAKWRIPSAEATISGGAVVVGSSITFWRTKKHNLEIKAANPLGSKNL